MKADRFMVPRIPSPVLAILLVAACVAVVMLPGCGGGFEDDDSVAACQAAKPTPPDTKAVPATPCRAHGV